MHSGVWMRQSAAISCATFGLPRGFPDCPGCQAVCGSLRGVLVCVLAGTARCLRNSLTLLYNFSCFGYVVGCRQRSFSGYIGHYALNDGVDVRWLLWVSATVPRLFATV